MISNVWSAGRQTQTKNRLIKGSIMNSRERIHAIIAREKSDRCGFFLGIPVKESWPAYYQFFGTESQEEIRQKLGDDIRWITPQFFRSTWQNVENMGLLYAAIKTSHGQRGPLADCEKVAEVDAFKWPDASQLDFTKCIGVLERTTEHYRSSGMWTPFFHNCIDIFGMEDYMVKMHTHPEVVHAVTDRICQFYYDANERFFEEAGDRVDGFFFGNDLGTQENLICSPDHLAEYVLPWTRRFIDQGHDHGHQVLLHSCGSIYKIIEELIGAGIDCINPLQAKAANMDADTLAKEFKGRVTFMGGIDTQDLLVNGTPDEVRRDVERIRSILGPHFIVSPSHDSLLPNVPPENVLAMAEAVTS